MEKLAHQKSNVAAPRGCTFLLEPVGSTPIFTPEQLTEDQRMFGDAANEFMEREVLTRIAEIERKEPGLMPRLLKRAGEAGLLMSEIPEAYGGLDLDKISATLIGEAVARNGSFGASMGAHVSIGTMPLVCFGNHEQKERFLPRLATGELLAAYCLTEPGSGSDAQGARTRAVLSEDGTEWILDGQKIWITNGGFADLFTVFAKVDGEHFSAFLVERTREGVSTGEEEHKLGINGSSTVQVYFEKVHIPKQNLLGEVGKGHKIAFNILNMGRQKLGAGSIALGRHVFATAVRYANERHQFKRPIASFGAIQHKIAEMAAAIYAGESMSYRIAGAIDEVLKGVDKDDPMAMLKAVEEFAVESSVLKVFGTEALQMVTDEALQIHGGYGFSAEYPVERIYRDIRVNRIFEGTNEINRMLIPGMILKRAIKGQLNLFGAVQKAQAALEADAPRLPATEARTPLATEIALTENAKQLVLLVANTAIQKHMADLRDQQQLLLSLADLIIDVFVMDSTTARTRLLHHNGNASAIHDQLTELTVVSAYRRILATIDELVPSLETNADKRDAFLAQLDHLRLRPTSALIQLRRDIAAHFIAREKYSL